MRIRRHPISPRTGPLFPYTTLFRSPADAPRGPISDLDDAGRLNHGAQPRVQRGRLERLVLPRDRSDRVPGAGNVDFPCRGKPCVVDLVVRVAGALVIGNALPIFDDVARRTVVMIPNMLTHRGSDIGACRTAALDNALHRSEEHTSELQSLMNI